MASDLDELRSVVGDLDRLVVFASREQSLPDRDVRHLLAFLAQVIQVIEQAFQDLQSLLVELRFLQPADVNDPHLTRELQRRAALLTARSHFRDAAEICSRLKHLGETFDQSIRPRVSHLTEFTGWGGVFGLIEHREGRIIRLVEETARSVTARLDSMSPTNIGAIRDWAQTRIDELRALVSELHSLNGRIMGYSGEAGFLELTSDRNRLAHEVSIMIDKRDQSTTHGHRVEVGSGSTITQLVVATTITDSFKTTISESKGTSALKDELQRLCAQLDQMLPALPNERQAEVRKDADTLIAEATKEQPRRKWYELSAEGIVEAAKTCGAVAAPVIATVQKIVSLLTGAPV